MTVPGSPADEPATSRPSAPPRARRAEDHAAARASMRRARLTPRASAHPAAAAPRRVRRPPRSACDRPRQGPVRPRPRSSRQPPAPTPGRTRRGRPSKAPCAGGRRIAPGSPAATAPRRHADRSAAPAAGRSRSGSPVHRAPAPALHQEPPVRADARAPAPLRHRRRRRRRDAGPARPGLDLRRPARPTRATSSATSCGPARSATSCRSTRGPPIVIGVYPMRRPCSPATPLSRVRPAGSRRLRGRLSMADERGRLEDVGG